MAFRAGLGANVSIVGPTGLGDDANVFVWPALAQRRSIEPASRSAAFGNLGPATRRNEFPCQSMPLPMLRFSSSSHVPTLFSLRGGPNYQCRFKDDGSSARSLFGLKQTEDKFGSMLANHLAVLIDARQAEPEGSRQSVKFPQPIRAMSSGILRPASRMQSWLRSQADR